MVTPTWAPSALAHWPPQFTTYSHSISPRAVRTAVSRPRSVTKPVTLVRSRIVTPACRAPLARAWVMSDGLALASFGSQTAPARSPAYISGQRSAASATGMMCASTPCAVAESTVRRSWTMRSREAATHSAPLWFHPVPWPVSSSRLAYSRLLSSMSRVSDGWVRNCPTMPAACHVVPQDSWPCSSRTTSVQPSWARW